MAGAVAVVLALGAKREAVQAVRGADGSETILPAGEQFVHVRLMADVPHELVLWRFEHPMQSHRQFHHAEVRPEVSAVIGQAADQFLAQFLRQFLELLHRQFFDVSRVVHHVEVAVGRLGFCHVKIRLSCRRQVRPRRRRWVAVF